MKIALSALAGVMALAVIGPAEAAEKPKDLHEKGYGIVARDPDILFQGCDYGQAYYMNDDVFVCAEYAPEDMVAGKVYVMGRIYNSVETVHTHFYLCTEADRCYEGAFYKLEDR